MRTFRSITQKRGYAILALFILFASPAIADNFVECLSNSLQAVRDGQHGKIGSDNQGRMIADMTKATSIPYKFCVQQCGGGPEAFDWILFSQQSSSWLIPWLALMSQLPFGSNDNLDNFSSILLTLGSPTLAAYSLVLTALNRRWVARRFASSAYPNTRHAVRILDSLQQSSLVVTTDDCLLASLVVLPENDGWWKELAASLDFPYNWSISAIASISWVVIAYVCIVVNSFIRVDDIATINSVGRGIGSLWIWLLPIVISWNKISPKSDAKCISQALMRANNMAYVATSEEPVLASTVSGRHAISLAKRAGLASHPNASCTVPIYNYVRFLSWVHAVEQVSDMFRAASERTHTMHQSVDPDVDWQEGERSGAKPHQRNRRGNRKQVEAYCTSTGEASSGRAVWGPNVFSRIFIASGVALLLQWGTTGAAAVAAWFTPTTGLGCRSGSYILYASMSTLVWMILILSSFLSHYASAALYPELPTSISSHAQKISLSLHRLGTTLATLNAVWMVVLCLLHFSNVFESCYCYSSVLGRGVNSFTVVEFTASSARTMRGSEIGGMVLATGSVLMFMMFVNLLLKPQLSDT